MSDLIARLEAATEGSRELDAEIGRAVIGFDPRMLPTHIPDIGEIPSPWPRYTTSVDAALTLVPDGCLWGVEWDPKENSSLAYVGEVDNKRAATPALALVIAAIRARSAP